MMKILLASIILLSIRNGIRTTGHKLTVDDLSSYLNSSKERNIDIEIEIDGGSDTGGESTNGKGLKGCGALDPNGKPLVTSLQYMKIRDSALKDEEQYRLGGKIKLNQRERLANDVLMAYKRREFEQGIDRNGDKILFPGGIHIYHMMKYINGSNVFKIIKIFPKAGVLHLHDLQSGSMLYAVELTKILPNLYMCWDRFSVLRFQFFTRPVATSFCDEDKWISVAKFRRNSSGEAFVDEIFLKKLRLFTDTPEIDYPDNNAAWRVFFNTIITGSGLLGYEKALELYFYNLLQQFYDDNCQYIEVRSLLQYFYRLDEENPELTSEEVLKIFKDTAERFVKAHPDFWGAKIIYSPQRLISNEMMAVKVSDAVRLKKMFPDFLAGFDMAYHEDLGNTLNFYRSELLNASAQGLKFFFHAGETDWHGTKIDDNLMDAVLLNATRIGHGTALNARPYLVDIIRERGIGVEVNPVSSQVLKLSSADSRTHPTIPFVREGFPMIISCDDAGSLGTDSLSYDWYLAFMSMGGERADLRFLKQLALNSIKYSGMCEEEKQRNLKRWQRKWNEFLKRVVLEFRNPDLS